VITYRVTLEVFSDPDGSMPLDRLMDMIRQADSLQGQLSAPLDYVPVTGDQGWGLRIVIEAEGETLP
jgi:hypothetical protein